MEDNKTTETAEIRPPGRPNKLPAGRVVEQSHVGFWRATNALIDRIPKEQRRALYQQMRAAVHGLAVAYAEALGIPEKENENN